MKNSRLSLLLVVGLLALVGCVDLPPPALTANPMQAGWFAQRNQQSPTFRIADSEVAEAWVRARLWIANYPDFKLQTVDEVLLESYYPPGEPAAR